MEITFLVARILALTYISAGIAALTGKISFQKMAEDFEKSPVLVFLSGFLALVIGMILVHYHNIWVKSWVVIITIVGWVTLIKGITLIAFPQFISFFKKKYKNTMGWGIFMIVLGLIFGYIGFFI